VKFILPKSVKVGGVVYAIIEDPYYYNTGGDDHSENLIERISEVVRMFIADNPNLVRHLADVLESHVGEGSQGREADDGQA
jgi:hypothetical protein